MFHDSMVFGIFAVRQFRTEPLSVSKEIEKILDPMRVLGSLPNVTESSIQNTRLGRPFLTTRAFDL